MRNPSFIPWNSFFVNHPDQKDREKYLKDYHGEYSGYHGGNDNRTYTSKGLSFSHGDLTQPYAKVELKWSVIVKRIDALMSQDRFLSDKDREAMAGYEIRQLARSIHSFFIDAPDLYPRPYQANAIADYWEGVEEVAGQLTDPARVEDIYQMMLPLWEGTPQDDRHYQSRKTGLENGQPLCVAVYYHFVNAEDEAAFDEFIAECKSLALYDTGVTAEYGDKLITLSTCEYSRTNGRMVIVAKLVVPSAEEVDADAGH